ncbi:MAG: ATP-binding protein [Pseudomonadota bacterium]
MHTQTQLREHRDALARSNMELRHSNEELEQFAYIASHDLQEPLNTVTGFANLLMMDYGSVLDEVGKQYLTHMIQSTGRMQDLIAALLDYSRLGRNQQTAMIDCTKLVEKVLADLSSVILTSQAIIHTGSLPTLIGYEQELERLFQNLIKNALKFQPPSAKPSIEITSEQCEEGWQFSVKDNGIGIAPEFHQKIFAIFQRLHTRDKYEGTGIGLSQCRKIIELHNGRIWVESAPGQGCTFYFILPRLIAHGD